MGKVLLFQKPDSSLGAPASEASLAPTHYEPRRSRRQRSAVVTVVGLRCYYRRDMTRPNGATHIRLYFKDDRGHKQRLDLCDATAASWIQPGVYYTLEQIADAPRRRKRRGS